jgi:hypothetical protein
MQEQVDLISILSNQKSLINILILAMNGKNVAALYRQ